AEDLASVVKAALAKKPEIAIIMALGAAQDAFYTALRARTDIEWSRITVLHVDTYMGVAETWTESGASRVRKLRWTRRASRQAVIPETMGMTAPSGQGGRLATA